MRKTGRAIAESAARDAVPAGPWRVLLVDDSRAQRRLLRASLDRWGYSVSEAGSAEEALSLARAARFDIVLSDWVMPGMSGLDLCRAFRALPQENYGYFILLTSKSATEEVASGLDAGADDFLAKPVSADELRARLKAGERILGMQRELTDKNRLLGAALSQLRELYDSLDRDLIEARKLQQSLVRERCRDFGTAAVSLLLRPSGHVGGDLVGYHAIDATRIAFFAVDVSGHGVAAAMMAARLAGMFSAATAEGNITLDLARSPVAAPLPPETVAERLNTLVSEVMQVDQYLTCVFCDADILSGRVSLVQAGHPHPLLLRAGGGVERIGSGGLPIGLLRDARWVRVDLQMQPGDRLVLVSDGFTECAGPTGEELGEDRLAALLAQTRDLPGAEQLDTLLWEVEGFAGSAEFGDDMSAVLYEFRGQPA